MTANEIREMTENAKIKKIEDKQREIEHLKNQAKILYKIEIEDKIIEQAKRGQDMAVLQCDAKLGIKLAPYFCEIANEKGFRALHHGNRIVIYW